MRSALPFVSLLSILHGCGVAVHPPTEPAPKREAAPKPAEPALDLSKIATPVQLGGEVEMRGYQAVWFQGTELRIELVETKWDEVTAGGKSEREGRAKLNVTHGTELRTVTIDEGDEKALFGFRISVSYAYEVYDPKDASYAPHVKLKVIR